MKGFIRSYGIALEVVFAAWDFCPRAERQGVISLWNHRCRHRALPTPWNGTRFVRDGVRSGFGHRDRVDRRIGRRGADLATGYIDVEWVLHRAVRHIGLAVSKGGMWGTRMTRGVKSCYCRRSRRVVVNYSLGIRSRAQRLDEQGK